MLRRRILPVAVLLAAVIGIWQTVALLQQPAGSPADRFIVRDAMIPMRDGVRLHTKIFTPREQREALPIIMSRTPYGVEDAAGNFAGYLEALAADGYVFVFQDIRGKYGSEGHFVMMRPPRSGEQSSAIDEGSDAYDTIEWLLKNVPRNNGRVGMLGISYDGWTTIMAALEPHPALKAISPQASPADMWLGDDFHHNGAFRLSYGFEYATMMESGKDVEQFTFDRYDTYDWYLALGPLSNVNARFLHGRIPTWNDYVAHPDYDEFWRRQTLVPFLRDVKVPTLNVAGWWDQEDFYGPVRIYDALEPHDARQQNYLVVGPWNHGGWARGTGESLGRIPFGNRTSTYFRDQVQAPWFAYLLKDKGKLALPEALTFEAGTNTWRRWNAWPPKQETTDRAIYFGENERLSFDKPSASALRATARLAAADVGGTSARPSADAAFDSYVSDPSHPVPYRHRPIQGTYFPGGSGWYTWLTEDQRFVEHRPDVLSWETAPLERDLTIAGNVVAHLFASTTGSDADWIVKLIDVYPEDYPTNWNLAGYQLMVSNEVFRGRYRNSFEKSEPIEPNRILDYTFSLHTQDYTFLKDHRIMVQVQSTWFPLIDRNPQKFVPNIFEARSTDFQVATHRIYRSADYPSHVVLPVVKY